MKGNAGPELERVGQPIRRKLEALCKQRPDGAVFFIADETLDRVQDHRIRIVVAVDAGIGAADVSRNCRGNRLGGGRCRDQPQCQ